MVCRTFCIPIRNRCLLIFLLSVYISVVLDGVFCSFSLTDSFFLSNTARRGQFQLYLFELVALLKKPMGEHTMATYAIVQIYPSEKLKTRTWHSPQTNALHILPSVGISANGLPSIDGKRQICSQPHRPIGGRLVTEELRWRSNM